jgi:hypothetical protein
MRYERNVKAVRRALEIHRRRFDDSLHGTRFLVRETVFYEWECRAGCGKWQAPGFMSRAAKKGARRDWAYEHAVPLNIVVNQLEELGEAPSLEGIRIVLKKWDIPVIVTKREAARLKEKGLERKMPQGWAGLGEPFARYDCCRISVDSRPSARGRRDA